MKIKKEEIKFLTLEIRDNFTYKNRLFYLLFHFSFLSFFKIYYFYPNDNIFI